VRNADMGQLRNRVLPQTGPRQPALTTQTHNVRTPGPCKVGHEVVASRVPATASGHAVPLQVRRCTPAPGPTPWCQPEVSARIASWVAVRTTASSRSGSGGWLAAAVAAPNGRWLNTNLTLHPAFYSCVTCGDATGHELLGASRYKLVP